MSAPTIDVQLTEVIEESPILDALGLGDLVPELDANLLATNPHFRHAESTRNGLAIVDVSAGEVGVTFIEVSDVTRKTGTVEREVSFVTRAGSSSIERR